MSKSKVLFIMTGSIASYKACQALSKLAQAGLEVKVVATKSALQFVGKATLEGLTGNKVLTDLYEDGQMMDHIHLVRWADLIVVAPASANYLNKIANGLADDLASTLFLAHDFKKAWLVAPAMNSAMYMHPNTQASLAKLKSFGVKVIEPSSGALACGEVGPGRLVEPEIITTEVLTELQISPGKSDFGIRKASAAHKTSNPMRVLITAGGTTEPIDGVRVLTNISSGRTGAQIAQQLNDFGLQVDLLLAKSASTAGVSDEIHVFEFQSYGDLEKLMKERLSEINYTAVIHLAAVSDYSVVGTEVNGKFFATNSNSKISSSNDEMKLVLRKNPKLISLIKDWSRNKDIKLIGFKLTNSDQVSTRQEAIDKLIKDSHPDLVVQNDVSEISNQQHIFHVHNQTGIKESSCIGAHELSAVLAQKISENLKESIFEQGQEL